MAYLSRDQLERLGFRSLGKNVLVSDKASIYDHDRIEIGDNSRIDDFCVVSGRVVIGRNVFISVFCNVAGGEPGVVMEDFTGLAYGCYVFSQSDDYSGRTMTNSTVPDEYKSEKKAAVRIGRHCIVGARSVVLPGVTLAEGTAVGAMTMVTKSTQPWSVYFGVPAKRLKRRRRDLLELERQYLADEQP
ncbi:acyltransferase [Rhodoplanes sp. TEM]|uniref:Chloramphenicol acetyltransferase n=1 Tax=Rhodoplanes tepidamans TaxID=200616 RepID=A0ABT5JEA5_RHOTP|nr:MULTISPECIES: acyltransferase [Rhodoplanes]MDC7787415.1 acyltransferase [Rhodoplanes tepidamans]MDC7985534.1 acyltransferase [Rhodoplanes sp. TEM]MDQ0358099.1 galactoside O-acetyltransferase [Rhodoplanes tepidamans]